MLTLLGKCITLAIPLTGTRPSLLNGLYRYDVMLPQSAALLRSATAMLNPRSSVPPAVGTP